MPQLTKNTRLKPDTSANPIYRLISEMLRLVDSSNSCACRMRASRQYRLGDLPMIRWNSATQMIFPICLPKP